MVVVLLISCFASHTAIHRSAIPISQDSCRSRGIGGVPTIVSATVVPASEA